LETGRAGPGLIISARADLWRTAGHANGRFKQRSAGSLVVPANNFMSMGIVLVEFEKELR